ncbi:phosphatidate phosphatase LPIN3-like [Myxocyprinus asiaticus]|uniref:phosphatidate phosphatase LPIN3-like n=1 Tax=Myxocyprinus asiaticus TaxID=70543 RepID=UPI002222F349|nr:phosphatidate phosphatase LPIN3-like [Myxocyprinus asiaticus]
MNYVGQLAETVFVTIKELYHGLNPATLTNGIDVIVVRQPDGSFQCSPFHVRFGKLGVLQSKEKVVDIEINGEPVNLHMKLGDNGEAFFVEENEDFETRVPAHLCTSPIPTDVPEVPELTESPFSVTSLSSRHKKRCRKRAHSDTQMDVNSSSDEKESLDQDVHKEESPMVTSKSIYYSLSEEPYEELSGAKSRYVHPHSDGECSVNESTVFYSHPSSPKSDSELFKPQKSVGPHMQWNRGAFPKVCQAERDESDALYVPPSPLMPSDHSHFRTIHWQASFDVETTDSTALITIVRAETQIATTIPVPSEVYQSSAEKLSLNMGEPEDGAGVETLLTNQNSDSAGLTASVESAIRSEGSAFSASLSFPVVCLCPVKRIHHLGPTDIYLEDLSSLNSEVAALYFPKSEAESELCSNHPPNLSPPLDQPLSLGSRNRDSGTEYLSDSTTDTLDVTMALCGRGDISQISKEKFTEQLVKYQDFVNNPGIVEDPNLVICINSKYYNWAVTASMILLVQAFQKNLPKSTVVQLVKDKMPKKSARWWFSWRRKDMNNIERSSKPDSEGNQLEASASVAGPSTLKKCSVELSCDDDDSISVRQKSDSLNTAQCISQTCHKSLRLTSEQIECLHLCEGANKVVFSVTTQYQGTCRCEAPIYLLNYNDKIIISDIDGTITKSDALGHILPQLGKDWTHHGIAKLYHKIHQNGYNFLYCSARAIGMADITKDYLQWMNDRGTVLPKGPVFLAPSSLFSALHREVVEKKPEVFKIACLTDIRDLFNPIRRLFYAAFGNRTNDAYAYKEVGVPETHIFTVNPKGELIQEKTKANKSSYSHLSELVDYVFPFICNDPTTSFDCPEISNFSFLREPLPVVDLAALI